MSELCLAAVAVLHDADCGASFFDHGLSRSAYGTHSLRRTKVALIDKRTGNLRAVQILLGHPKLESTVRYLGLDAEEAMALSEATEV